MRFAHTTVLVLAVALAALVPCSHSAASAALRADPDEPAMETETDPKYKFPEGFLFGAGTASYQSEGAWDVDGKGENVFDHTYHKLNYTTWKTGDIACDSYNRYEEDIKLAAELKLDVYRFSISWARIFPNGNMSEKPNELGVQHYHKVIKAIKDNNMKPMITIYHFDHPQMLETRFKGWLGSEMIQHFVDFADFVFNEYGADIDHWVTINEPNMHCMLAYGNGLPPGSNETHFTAEDMYTCIHHEILAHAYTYRLYQQKYAAQQKGQLGIGAVTFFARPNTTEWDDILASERSNMFDVGLMLHPLVFGDYPQVVKDTLKAAGKERRIHVFSEDEKKVILGAIDFVGLNAYFGSHVADPAKASTSGSGSGTLSFDGPQRDANVTKIQSMSFSNAFARVEGWILRDVTLWIKATFGPDLGVFFTENGTGVEEDTIDDWNTRAVYHSAYLRELMRTINVDKVKVIGYTVWTFLDDFEWSGGYISRRFGMVRVDYDGENPSLNRTLKRSKYFFQKMMTDRSVPLVEASTSSGAAISSSMLLAWASVFSLLKLRFLQ